MNNKHLRNSQQPDASRNYQLNVRRYNKLVHVIPNKTFYNELNDHPEYTAKLRASLKANLLNSCEHSILELYNNDDRAWVDDLADYGFEYAIIWPDGTWPQGEFEENLLNVLDELNKATKRNSSWLAVGKIHEMKHKLFMFTEGFDYSYPIIINLNQYIKADRPQWFKLDTESIFEFMDELVPRLRSTNPTTGKYVKRDLEDIIAQDEHTLRSNNEIDGRIEDDALTTYGEGQYVPGLGSLNNFEHMGGNQHTEALSSIDLHYDALFRVGNVVDILKSVARQTITLDNLNAENLSETKEGSQQNTNDLNNNLNSPTAKASTMRLMLNTILDMHTDNPIENLNDVLKWINNNDIVGTILSSSDDNDLPVKPQSDTINIDALNSARSFGDTMTHSRLNLYSLKLLQYQIVYITNTESIPISDYNSNSIHSQLHNSHEVMLLPCSGLHQFYHILANPNCKRVIWYDFNPYSVEWTKKVLNDFYVSQGEIDKDSDSLVSVAQQFDDFVYENRRSICADGVILDDNIEYDFDNVEEFFNVHFANDGRMFRLLDEDSTPVYTEVSDENFGADIFDVDSWRSKLESDAQFLNEGAKNSGERFALSGEDELGRTYWWEKLEHIKSLDHSFIVCDAVKDWETLANAVGVDSHVFMQLTNIWQYEVNYLNSDGLDAQIAFLNLINTVLKNNKSLHFTGDTPSGIHYRNKNIAELKGIY